MDRIFWTALRQCWSRWSEVLITVKPETVVGSHRAGFRLYWRCCSWRGSGRPKIAEEIRVLIRRLAEENPDWGAPKIHGELQKLGFVISERSIARYRRRIRRRGDPGKRWLAFLQNHREAIVAFDFFTVPTVKFQLLYCFFVIEHARRRILHFNVTRHPSADWVVQQLRATFPEAGSYRYVILDRDAKFDDSVMTFLRATALRPKRASVQAPWQNGTAERWIGSCRRELLDHIIALNERHLVRLLREYVSYYHQDRVHDSLEKDTPESRPVEPKPEANATVISLPPAGRVAPSLRLARSGISDSLVRYLQERPTSFMRNFRNFPLQRRSQRRCCHGHTDSCFQFPNRNLRLPTLARRNQHPDRCYCNCSAMQVWF